MSLRPRFTVCLLTALLVGCNAENVQWAFVSNPGGSFGTTGGAVVVIRISSSSSAGVEGRFLRVAGDDERGPVEVLLPYQGDFAVLSRAGSVEVRSPSLSYDNGGNRTPGRVEVQGATLQTGAPGGPAALDLRLPNAAVVHPGGVGPGVLHIASNGTLMVLESGAGLVVFGEEPEPELIGLSATLTTTPFGDQYALLGPNGVLRVLVPPPAPRPEARVVFVSEHDSVRILGPTGEALAEIPRQNVQLQNGAAGVFLTASLPDGLPGDRVPMSLLMAADNRYLLRA
ncbi:MAG TPA: hypothetical protein VFZ65_18915, partial [Planctomycetota bacterium]|nr:hypothetical protein [Planctomycetota bacterium]